MRRRLLESVFDHVKKRLFLLLSVDCPIRAKDLMTTVLRIGLRKHHEFNVCWVTLHLRESTS